jgi:hypothetical protein
MANPTTKDLRKAFHESVLRSDKLPAFLSSVKALKNPTPIEKAYIGASEALRARESWNPIDKLVYIHSYRKYLDEAVESDKENIEIRFLRFSIEYNIPELIRSKKSIVEDKYIILSKLNQMDSFGIDEFMVNYILVFFEDTKLCTQTEIDFLRKKLGG